MSVINTSALAGASGQGGGGYEIERSLRFNSDDSAHLSKTFSSGSGSTKNTFSFWVKRTKAGQVQQIFTSGTSNADTCGLGFGYNINDVLFFSIYRNSQVCLIETNRLFRDHSAWLHVVLIYDSTLSTANDRVQIWVNGVREDPSSLRTNTQPAQNTVGTWGKNTLHNISKNWNAAGYLNGYLAEVHFLDGIAASASDFGEYDDNNVWQPKKYEGSYNAAGSGVIYSGMLSASNGFAIAATSAFDGDTTTEARANLSADNYLEFTPTTPISFTNGAHVWCYSPNGFGITNYWSVDLDGNGLGSETSFVGSSTANFNGSAWVQVATGSGTLHKVRIRLTRSGGSSGAAIGAFAINGTSAGNILVDGTVAGVNGFHLDFSDNSSDSALGTDSSGNSHDWTVNNLTAGINSISSPNSPGWASAGSNWSVSNSNQDASYSGSSSYSTQLATALSNNTTYHFFLEQYAGSGDSYSGWFFSTDSSEGGTVPNELGDDTLGMRVGQTTIGAHGSYATANGVSSGQSALSGFSSIQANTSGGAATTTEFVINTSVDKVWVRPVGGSWIGGGDPSNTSSTASFNIVSDSTQYFAYIAYTSGTYAKFKTSAGDASDIDSLRDSPNNGDPANDTGAGGELSGNYATWNPLTNRGVVTTSNGNLTANAVNTNYGYTLSTLPMRSGKYYCELTFEGEMNHSTNYNYIGIVPTDSAAAYTGQDIFRANGALSIDSNSSIIRGTIGTGSGDTNNTYQSSYGFDETDTIGIAIDCDTPQVTFYKNGTSIGTFPHAMQVDKSWVVFINDWATGADFTGYILNAGQRTFNHAAPSNFKAMCTANLPDPTIADSSTAFDAKLWTGNGSTQNITGYSFSPDLVWTKQRNGAGFPALFDPIRGVHNAVRTNSANGTYTDNGLLTAFNSDGFSIGSAGDINGNNNTYVGWAWEGGDLVTNSAYNQSQTWSNSLTSSTGFRGSEPATSAFDGSTSTTCSAVGSGIVTYTSPVTVSSSETIRVYVNGGTTNVSVNGGSDQAVSAGSFVTLQFDNPSTTPFTLAFQRPGSADTGVRAIEIGGKVLVDPGVIPIASLNSVMYNKSQTWSTYGTFDNNYSAASYQWPGVFNTGNYFTSYQCLYVNSSSVYDTWTLTSPISVSSSVGVRVAGSAKIKINAGLSDETTATSTGNNHHHLDIPFTGNLSSIGVAGNNTTYLCAIYVDGKQLVDPNLTSYYHDSPSISATVRANPSTGVSIVQYTGTMSSGDRVAHGLNAAPSVLLIKNTATDNTPWQMYHTVGGNQWSIEPSDGAQPNTSSSNWYYQSPNSSVFYLGGNANVNASSTNSMIAYCFAEVEGFSKFGGFEGNSSTDGPFIYTGFKPAFLIIKGYDGNHYWAMHDIARDPTNTGDKQYFWVNDSGSEGNGYDVDFLSNGFKLRNNNGNWNTSGSYLYLAFAAKPFKTGRAH